ncbi:MAG: glycosyltransferase [Acidobacteria bacterium]|nr:glycosyltransferase [Acidobacteriota bacterium]
MTPGLPVVLVVPCFDEAARLPVQTFEAAIDASDLGLVFVDDGSVDDTPALLGRLAGREPGRITVLRATSNRGKAEAVRIGMAAARLAGPRYVGYWDADLSTPLAALPDFVAVLDANPQCHMVLGSRVKAMGRTIDRRAIRHYAGRVFATAASASLGLPIYDTQCGAKLFRATSDVWRLFDQPFVSRWAFDVEVLARYIRQCGSRQVASDRLEELPLRVWRHVPGSKVRPLHLLRALIDLWRIRQRYLGGRTAATADLAP